MIKYHYVPDGFGSGTIIPIPKNTRGPNDKNGTLPGYHDPRQNLKEQTMNTEHLTGGLIG